MTEDYKFANEEEKDVFWFLDGLRESGQTNMYGAPAYLQDEYDFDSPTAKKYVAKWMKTFSQRHP